MKKIFAKKIYYKNFVVINTSRFELFLCDT